MRISLAQFDLDDDHGSPRASPGNPPSRDKGGGMRKRDKETKTTPPRLRQDAQKPKITQHDLDDLPNPTSTCT